MITKEIYNDRTPLTEEQKQKHLQYLKGMLDEYLVTHIKASHSKVFANKMTRVMESYMKTGDLHQGIDICNEVLKYNADDLEKYKKIHFVVSRTVHTTIKNLEYNMDTDLLEKVRKLITKISPEYQIQYRDCYSKLAHIYLNNEEYDIAMELYTTLAAIECDMPAKTIVPASYLLTYCYIQINKSRLSEYDIATTKDYLDDYSNCGGADYYNIRGTVECLENDLKTVYHPTQQTQQHTCTHLNK